MDSFGESSLSGGDEIIPGLWVGDMNFATSFQGICITVHEDIGVVPDSHYSIHLPILRYDESKNIIGVNLRNFRDIYTLINSGLSSGDKVLIHCAAGIERSPLTVALFLSEYKNIPLSEAYRIIKEKRPEIQERMHWVYS